MNKQFENQVVIVTGAASGIGRATALIFAQRGAKLVLADVQKEKGEVLAHEIAGAGRQAIFVPCDIARENQVEALVRAAVSHFGGLDVAFNNAGIEGVPGATTACSEENWDRVINTNLKGTWLCLKHELPEMLKRKRGAIVNCASIAGVVGFAGAAAYDASKHGVIGLTQSVALEYAKQNIRINAVCPGVIQTPMIDRFTGKNPQALADLTRSEPMARLGRPEEIGYAVAWLSSPEASFVTGHALAVDGGWTAQ